MTMGHFTDFSLSNLPPSSSFNSRKKNVVGVLEIFNKLSPALSTTIRIRNLPKGKIDTIKKPKDD